MRLIEQQPHFWELYQDNDRYYLSIAVDMSSVVSCWDIALTEMEVQHFQCNGRIAIEELANTIVAETYRGDFSNLEARKVSTDIQKELQHAYKTLKSKMILISSVLSIQIKLITDRVNGKTIIFNQLNFK